MFAQGPRGHYLFIIKSHLQSYPCPININCFWNAGFLLVISIVLQLITGILLALHYTPDINYSYYSIIREVYYGWSLRYIHSNGASFLFTVLFIHIGRGLYYGSYYYTSNVWFSGIFIFLILMAIAFIGYVLPWGQMSFWGATVITNLLSAFPCLIEWICGGFYISSPTLKRFFIFHFILPFIICGIIIIHVYYLHYLSSNNSLGYNINNFKILFFPFINYKDIFGLLLWGNNTKIQLFIGIFTLSHPDNAFQVNELVTPLHIVPEWYFLSYYTMLKAIPNKNAGFIILLTSILILLLFGESRRLNFNSNFYNIHFFLIIICFLWIGAQLPQEIFISYGRILTLFYYKIIVYYLYDIAGLDVELGNVIKVYPKRINGIPELCGHPSRPSKTQNLLEKVNGKGMLPDTQTRKCLFFGV